VGKEVQTHSVTSALDGGVLSASRPGRFTSGGITRYPFTRRLGRFEPVWTYWRKGKSAPLPGFEPRIVQTVV